MAEDPFIARARNMALNALRKMAMMRARSYRRTFLRGGGLDRDAEIVLADLRNFCCGNATTFSPDPHVASRRQGRREVWLRVTQHLNLDEAKIQQLVELDDGL